jgi:hypothetical protein
MGLGPLPELQRPVHRIRRTVASDDLLGPTELESHDHAFETGAFDAAET